MAQTPHLAISIRFIIYYYYLLFTYYLFIIIYYLLLFIDIYLFIIYLLLFVIYLLFIYYLLLFIIIYYYLLFIIIYLLLTLFRLGSFGAYRLGGTLCSPLFLLCLWSNYNQTWHDGALGQNLSKAIKIFLTSLHGVIKPFLVSFQVKIRVPLFFVQLS